MYKAILLENRPLWLKRGFFKDNKAHFCTQGVDEGPPVQFPDLNPMKTSESLVKKKRKQMDNQKP